MIDVEPVIDDLMGHLEQTNPGDPLGVYLFGSWMAGGLRPDSDIDVLLLTERSLSSASGANSLSSSCDSPEDGPRSRRGGHWR